MADYKHRFGPIWRLFKDIGNGAHAQVVAIDGTVTIADGGGSLTVDGPLTDAQLAARLPLHVCGYTDTERVAITRPADTTQYAVGDAWSSSTTAPAVPSITAARVAGGTGRITGLRVVCSANQTTRPSLKVLVFDTAFTALEDNAAMDLSDAEAARLVGVFPVIGVDWVATNAGAGAAGNIVLQCQVDEACAFKCLSGSQELYVAVLLMNAYTPVASETLTLIFDLEQD